MEMEDDLNKKMNNPTEESKLEESIQNMINKMMK